MAGVLISGPAGAGKSARAAEIMREWTGGPVVLADFQRIYAALAGVERMADGRYPERPEHDPLMPLVEFIRRRLIRQARERQVAVVATNSDGDLDRRRLLLDEIGDGAQEEVVDPGRAVVSARLADAAGVLSPG